MRDAEEQFDALQRRRGEGMYTPLRDMLADEAVERYRRALAEVSATRYETAYEQQQRLGHTDSVVCTDCGAFVMNVAAHDRFHAILAVTQPPLEGG